MSRLLKTLFVLAACAGSSAYAQTPASQTPASLTLSQATELAQAAVQACAAKNYQVAATVVDRGGNVLAMLRSDLSGPHTADASRRKAYTSLTMRAPTSALANAIENNPGARQLVAIDDFLILAGGVPIKVGNETIGAIGVGGAPGGNLDEECINVALAARK